jgi:hypothetical protein
LCHASFGQSPGELSGNFGPSTAAQELPALLPLQRGSLPRCNLVLKLRGQHYSPVQPKRFIAVVSILTRMDSYYHFLTTRCFKDWSSAGCGKRLAVVNKITRWRMSIDYLAARKIIHSHISSTGERNNCQLSSAWQSLVVPIERLDNGHC